MKGVGLGLVGCTFPVLLQLWLVATSNGRMNCSRDEDGTCGEMMCPTGGISATKCDCKFQCLDCSDESACYADPEFSKIFLCESGDGCTFLGECPHDCPDMHTPCTAFCDGVAECRDKSDEPQTGFGFRCPKHKHGAVLDGPWCVLPPKYLRRWKGVENVTDLADYKICSKEEDICYLQGSEFVDIGKCYQCADGTIINKKQLCDGKMDCSDYSDECLCENRVNATVPCVNEHDNGTVCVDITAVCQGTAECRSVVPDPTLCSAVSGEVKVRCVYAMGQDVVLCDGRPECAQMDDECNEHCEAEYCKYKDYVDFFFMANECKIDGKFCDGNVDCPGAIDEKDCPKRTACDPSDPNATYWYDNERQRCDGRVQCVENGIDEAGCDNNFNCKSGKIIHISQVQDGIVDCPDSEDECGRDLTSGGQYMIKSGILMALMWAMAAVALGGNAIVIVNSARDLRATYRRGATAAVTGRVGACNKTLVLNLALADFLMGIYLLILNIKAAEFSGSYCLYGTEWRSSSLCSALGSIAVLSSQTSVLIMVMMTTYRLYSVRMPFRADKLRVRYLVGFVVLGWIVPALVAFWPLTSHDKAFAVVLKSNLPFFKNHTVEKPDFEGVVRRAWALSNFSEASFGGADWSNLMDKYCSMYTEVCKSMSEGALVDKWLGYYSADSVCLPRLFPHIGDSGWEYTVVVIAFDFVAFLYILAAYLMMYSFTVGTTSESGNGTISFRGSSFSSVDELRSREDRVIWQRISRLLITDFLCWIPICITCLVSLLGEVNIPPMLYQVSAIIFLPVNSALNPLLYSNVISRLADRVCPKWLRFGSAEYAGICDKLMRRSRTQIPIDELRRGSTRAASGSDERNLSVDQLAGGSCADTRSITLSETDRSRPSAGGEHRIIYTPRKWSSSPDENVFLSDMPPINEKPEQRNGIAKSMAKFGRFFSEKNQRDLPPVRRHRPKSQSTTSTSTFFTTINQNE